MYSSDAVIEGGTAGEFLYHFGLRDADFDFAIRKTVWDGSPDVTVWFGLDDLTNFIDASTGMDPPTPGSDATYELTYATFPTKPLLTKPIRIAECGSHRDSRGL